MKEILSVKELRDLGRFDTCSVANAVDSFTVRLLNEGFSGPGITCRTPHLPPMVGHAVTLKVRSSEPPMKPGFYLEQPDWWERLENASYPRILVIEDTDVHPGRGTLVGPVHACILGALGFSGVVTSGAVRGLGQFAEIGLHAFSGSLSPSHSYCHVVEMGGIVEVAGLRIESGDILHGDLNGIVKIPVELAGKIQEAAGRIRERERAICHLCNNREFSAADLRRAINADSKSG